MRLRILLLAVSVVAHAALAGAQAGGGYDLTWNTIDGGGGPSSGGSYAVAGTVGQPDAGTTSGGGYELTGGFWAAGVPVLLGDCEIDGMVDLFDVLEMIDIVLGRTIPTPAQLGPCNANCDQVTTDIFDVLRTIDAVIGRLSLPLQCPVP